MAMLTYGLLPRLFTGWLAQSRLRAATRTAFDITPGVTAVLNRLHQAQVETTEPATRAASDPRAQTETRGAPASIPPSAVSVAINWAGVPFDDPTLSQCFSGARILQAGGGASLASDRAVVKTVVDECAEGAVAVVVKSWEPPLLELVDFLKELRQAIGPGREIVVTPLAMDTANQLIPPPAKALAVWQRQMNRANDPWLQTVPLTTPEVTS